MRLPDKVYDVLKWLALICLPALSTFYSVCGHIWGWPYAEEIAQTTHAVCVLLGALIGISTAEYRKDVRLDE